MFDIGWTELLAIGLVALIVIGPKELPTVLRTAGQWMGKVKRMASEFQGQFQEALREAEVADLKEQAEDLSNSLKSVTAYDPLADIDNDGEKDKDDGSDWDDTSFETPEPEPTPESAGETAAEPEPLPATPVAAVEAAPAAEASAKVESKAQSKPDTTTEDVKSADLTPAETPPPKQAGGSA